MEAAALIICLPISSSPFSTQTYKRKTLYPISLHHPPHLRTCSAPSLSSWGPFNRPRNGNDLFAVACLPSSPNQPSIPKTRLYVSGQFSLYLLSFLVKGYAPADNMVLVVCNEAMMNILLHAGLSFRTTEESLRNAFETFGQLVEVNLVMDKIANRPRGFAFLRYSTEEESEKAIEGMHGKWDLGWVRWILYPGIFA
ncbi:Organelle RRM domain-containing protein 6, chloroplastic [Vitis vinifera]|uniref:Organelle RRM domain-containing protein 6, chloroplastic n=1 Tax=Vitis vinifera TaxID=29760 RepID=A0A438HFS7_VITVI|nr:Organelle RRM domain-containing protein 6, chloroplastic [Vitis vinifera]